MRPESQYSLPDLFRLRKEARKSWDYFVTDRLIYGPKLVDCDLDPLFVVSEKHLGLGHWFELDISLAGEIENHLHIIIELIDPNGHSAVDVKVDLRDKGVHRDASMFVDVPKGVKNPEKLVLVGIPTVVRLKGPNRDHGPFRDTKSHFGESDLGIERVLPNNWKSNPFRGSDTRFNAGCELPCQVIESGPQATNEISSDQGHLHVRGVWGTKFDDVLACFNIVLKKEAISLCLSPRFYGLAEGIEVDLRPVDLMHYALYWHGRNDNTNVFG